MTYTINIIPKGELELAYEAQLNEINEALQLHRIKEKEIMALRNEAKAQLRTEYVKRKVLNAETHDMETYGGIYLKRALDSLVREGESYEQWTARKPPIFAYYDHDFVRERWYRIGGHDDSKYIKWLVELRSEKLKGTQLYEWGLVGAEETAYRQADPTEG